MRTVKICIFMLLLLFVVTTVQAQQSAFQGTWIGENNRSGYQLEITENNWSFFIDSVIQAAGTVSFSTGEARLLLANGTNYSFVTLLAPGLIQARIEIDMVRFRHIQDLPTIRIKNSTGYSIIQMYIYLPNTARGNNILREKALRAGETISINFPHSFDFSNQYRIILIDEKGDNYVKYFYITLNPLIEFAPDDLYNGPLDGR
jgi:hypothetical protein